MKMKMKKEERVGKNKNKKRKKKGVVNVVVNRGAWTEEEDHKLAEYVKCHGEKNWRVLPAKAGLKRCGKSCRLRWLNYLRPGIKRGNITDEEEDLIIRLHNLLGNRWSLIAGRLPGRTDNEIKNHWNTHLSRRSMSIDALNLKLNTTPTIDIAILPQLDPIESQRRSDSEFYDWEPRAETNHLLDYDYEFARWMGEDNNLLLFGWEAQAACEQPPPLWWSDELNSIDAFHFLH